MSLEILLPLHCGSATFAEDRIIYDLEIGRIISDDFLFPADKKRYLERKFIKESHETPNILPKGEELEPLPDLGKMKLIEAREFLEDEYDIVKLEKYFDQESSQRVPRKKLLEWIEKKSNELTGFESARVK